MGKNNKITPSDVKRLADKCKTIAESLNFENPIIKDKINESRNVIKPMEESKRYINLFEYSVPSDDERDNLKEVSSEGEVYKQIVADLEKELNTIAEVEVLEEGILDVLRNYAGKKLLTVAIIAQLLSTGKVTAQQLTDAGVESEKIEVAMDKVENDKQGRPVYFNFSSVKAWAYQGEKEYEVYQGYDLVTYQNSSSHKFINVPYRLRTSEEMAKTSEHYGMGNVMNYNLYKYDDVSDTTAGYGTDFYIIGNESKDKITYTVSDYPMEISVGDGDTLVFKGAQVAEGGTLGKSSFVNTSKGVEAARVGAKNTFYNLEGKKWFGIKANSASIVLVYGKASDKQIKAPKALEKKSSSLFSYNSVKVNTSNPEYQEMLEEIFKMITTDSIRDNFDFKLDVIGSSSQVPTNYPELSGEKTIEKNKQLAFDRSKALGIQLLKDLKAKGVDVSSIKKGKVDGVIGDTEYQNDPGNYSRYSSDQYAGYILTPVRK